MTTIEKGTEVVITTTATVRSVARDGRWIEATTPRSTTIAWTDDPDVSVVVVEPAPTTVETVIADHRPAFDVERGLYGGCLCRALPLRMAVTGQDVIDWELEHVRHLAQQLRTAGVAR